MVPPWRIELQFSARQADVIAIIPWWVAVMKGIEPLTLGLTVPCTTYCATSQNLAAEKGLEPLMPASKAVVLPLHHSTKLGCREGIQPS